VALDVSWATRAIARAVFRTMIPSYVRQGFSANAMILDARKYMPMYQRSTMLQDIRQFQGLFVGEKTQGALNRDKSIPLSKMPAVDYGDRPKYRVYGTTQVVNQYTGEVQSGMVSFFTNRHYSPEGYSNWMEDQIDLEECLPGWSLSGVDFRVVERNSRWL